MWMSERKAFHAEREEEAVRCAGAHMPTVLAMMAMGLVWLKESG